MTDASKGLEPISRAITPEEKALMKWLLEHGGKDAGNLVSQLDSVSVVYKCSCGCPTIYFALEGNPSSRKGEHLIRDYLATVDGQDVGVMLFEVGGQLSSLEVYSCAGADKPFGLPKIESVYSWEELPHRQKLKSKPQ